MLLYVALRAVIPLGHAVTPGVLTPSGPTEVRLVHAALQARRAGADLISTAAALRLNSSEAQKLTVELPFSARLSVDEARATLTALRALEPENTALAGAVCEDAACEVTLSLSPTSGALRPLGLRQARLAVNRAGQSPTGLKVSFSRAAAAEGVSLGAAPPVAGASASTSEVRMQGALLFSLDLLAGGSIVTSLLSTPVDATSSLGPTPLPVSWNLGGLAAWSGAPERLWILLDRELLRGGLTPELPGAPVGPYRIRDSVTYDYSAWEPSVGDHLSVRGAAPWALGPPAIRVDDPVVLARRADPYAAWRTPAFPGLVVGAPVGSPGVARGLVSGEQLVAVSGGPDAAFDGGVATAWCTTAATPTVSFSVVAPATGVVVLGGDRAGWIRDTCRPGGLPIEGEDEICRVYDPEAAWLASGRPAAMTLTDATGAPRGAARGGDGVERAKITAALEPGRYTLTIDEIAPGVGRGAPVCIAEIVAVTAPDPTFTELTQELR